MQRNKYVTRCNTRNTIERNRDTEAQLRDIILDHPLALNTPEKSVDTSLRAAEVSVWESSAIISWTSSSQRLSGRETVAPAGLKRGLIRRGNLFPIRPLFPKRGLRVYLLSPQLKHPNVVIYFRTVQEKRQRETKEKGKETTKRDKARQEITKKEKKALGVKRHLCNRFMRKNRETLNEGNLTCNYIRGESYLLKSGEFSLP
ncbi:hypothetical protein PUN28_000191 [Cardiocondyla obscurior]|uniref:Uncharacterized protein n=1 Tax=Cardiocondyla obscurior TaxID=286306 RepID=A0AAW2GY66_9HYME